MGEFMRIMGLDYGAKTVGVAISDEMLLTAQPIETIRRERPAKLRQTLARIESLMKDYDIDKVVIGLPKKLNNERRSGLEVIYQDERLTTVQADNVLAEGGVRKENRKQYIDKMAASLILQSYLDGLERN